MLNEKFYKFKNNININEDKIIDIYDEENNKCVIALTCTRNSLNSEYDSFNGYLAKSIKLSADGYMAFINQWGRAGGILYANDENAFNSLVSYCESQYSIVNTEHIDNKYGYISIKQGSTSAEIILLNVIDACIEILDLDIANKNIDFINFIELDFDNFTETHKYFKMKNEEDVSLDNNIYIGGDNWMSGFYHESNKLCSVGNSLDNIAISTDGYIYLTSNGSASAAYVENESALQLIISQITETGYNVDTTKLTLSNGWILCVEGESWNDLILYNADDLIIRFDNNVSNQFLNINSNLIDFLNNSSEKLDNIELPEELKILGSCTFFNSENLKSIIIPNNTEVIGYKSLYGSSLENITIPKNVNKILYNAFGNCSYLEEVIILSSSATFENSVFDGCTSLESINVPLRSLEYYKHQETLSQYKNIISSFLPLKITMGGTELVLPKKDILTLKTFGKYINDDIIIEITE